MEDRSGSQWGASDNQEKVHLLNLEFQDTFCDHPTDLPDFNIWTLKICLQNGAANTPPPNGDNEQSFFPGGALGIPIPRGKKHATVVELKERPVEAVVFSLEKVVKLDQEKE